MLCQDMLLYYIVLYCIISSVNFIIIYQDYCPQVMHEIIQNVTLLTRT